MKKGRLLRSYTFDASENLALQDPDGGRTTYAYDLARRISNVVNPLAERTTFAGDAAGQMLSQILANTAKASMSYDAAGRTTRVANLTSAGVTLSSFGYGYDAVGNRTNVVEAQNAITTLARTTWSYDPNYRLINENRNGSLAWASLTTDQWSQLTPDEWAGLETSGPAAAFNVTHTYDPVGNRLLQNSAGQLTTFAYDAANQLTTGRDGGGRTTFTFDLTGNVELQNAPAGRTTYAWDISKRLTQLWLPSGVVNTMVYNADDLRMGKTDSSGTEKFVWDGMSLLFETNISNVTQATYTLKPDHFGSLISQRRAGASSFHHFDALGSTMALTDISQNLTDAYLYQAYGASVGQFGSTVNPFQWVGKLGYFLDGDPAQYYVRARNYQPAWARWLSVDPLGFGAKDFNLYLYCGARPIIYIDPSGTWGWSTVGWFVAGVLVGVAIAAVVVVAAPIAVAGLVTAGLSQVTAVAVVSTGLAVAAGVGAGVTAINIYRDVSAGNWDAVVYGAGTLVGGVAFGASGGGRCLAKLGGKPSEVPRSWNPFGDRNLDLEYDSGYPDGSKIKWLGSAPSPNAGAGALGPIASGVGSEAEQR